jgi:hypothetical protein
MARAARAQAAADPTHGKTDRYVDLLANRCSVPLDILEGIFIGRALPHCIPELCTPAVAGWRSQPALSRWARPKGGSDIVRRPLLRRVPGFRTHRRLGGLGLWARAPHEPAGGVHHHMVVHHWAVHPGAAGDGASADPRDRRHSGDLVGSSAVCRARGPASSRSRSGGRSYVGHLPGC